METPPELPVGPLTRPCEPIWTTTAQALWLAQFRRTTSTRTAWTSARSVACLSTNATTVSTLGAALRLAWRAHDLGLQASRRTTCPPWMRLWGTALLLSAMCRAWPAPPGASVSHAPWPPPTPATQFRPGWSCSCLLAAPWSPRRGVGPGTGNRLRWPPNGGARGGWMGNAWSSGRSWLSNARNAAPLLGASAAWRPGKAVAARLRRRVSSLEPAPPSLSPLPSRPALKPWRSCATNTPLLPLRTLLRWGLLGLLWCPSSMRRPSSRLCGAHTEPALQVPLDCALTMCARPWRPRMATRLSPI